MDGCPIGRKFQLDTIPGQKVFITLTAIPGELSLKDTIVVSIIPPYFIGIHLAHCPLQLTTGQCHGNSDTDGVLCQHSRHGTVQGQKYCQNQNRRHFSLLFIASSSFLFLCCLWLRLFFEREPLTVFPTPVPYAFSDR